MNAELAVRGIRIGPRGIAAVLVVGLVGAMAIEPTRQLLEQRDRLSGMADELRNVQGSNRALEERIARLNDPDYIEQKAREQIGLVRPGETAIVVMPPSDRARAENRAKAARKKPVVAPPPPGFWEQLASFIGL